MAWASGSRAAGSGEAEQHRAIRTRHGPFRHQQPRLVVSAVVGGGDGAAVVGDLEGHGGREPGRTGPGRSTNDDRRRGTGEGALPCLAQDA